MVGEYFRYSVEQVLSRTPEAVSENLVTIIVSIIVTLTTVGLTKLFSGSDAPDNEEPMKPQKVDSVSGLVVRLP
jgi:hypothetical protein